MNPREWILTRLGESRLGRAKLPKPKEGFFNVGVTHLRNDPNDEEQRKILVALADLECVHLKPFDRNISELRFGRRAEGRSTARGYLDKSGFDALLWGKVYGSVNLAFELYWTLAAPRGEKSARPFNLEIDHSFRFDWNTLVDVLGLLVVSSASIFASTSGRYVADQASPSVERVRHLLRYRESDPYWRAAQPILRHWLAYALSVLGEQTGRNEHLREAVTAYREALKNYHRSRQRFDWAKTQDSLGCALQSLGARESGTERLEEAVVAHREALEVHTREAMPLDWAMTQNNLGNALQSLGARESGTEHLEEAVRAYRAALEVLTRQRSSHYRRIARANLDRAIALLSERGGPLTWIIRE